MSPKRPGPRGSFTAANAPHRDPGPAPTAPTQARKEGAKTRQALSQVGMALPTQLAPGTRKWLGRRSCGQYRAPGPLLLPSQVWAPAWCR